MAFLDKYGFPVERIRGRWFTNCLRLLLHTRKIRRRGSFRDALRESHDAGGRVWDRVEDPKALMHEIRGGTPAPTRPEE